MRTSVTLLLALLLAGPAFPAARAADYPARDAGYPSYREMVARIKAVAAEHPDIVRVFSIGRSYEGRRLWVAEVSDRPGLDEHLDAFVHLATRV